MYRILFYPLRKRKHYCDYLWLRTSLHRDGRLEPCGCATSHQPPVAPAGSIHAAWNSPRFTTTRRHLLDRTSGSNGWPYEESRSGFDCCTPCPVASEQRHLPLINYYSLLWRVMRRWPKNGPLIRRKLRNLDRLLREARRGATEISAYPVCANIDPANVCNLRCPECNVGAREHPHDPGFMTLERFQHALDEIGPYLLYLELFRYGEPLMNRDLPEMIEYAERRWQVFVAVSTNLALRPSDSYLERLVRSGLSEIIVAADDVDQDRYERYRRRGRVERVKENVRRLVRIRKALGSRTPFVRWQVLTFNFNEHRRRPIKQAVRRLGVDAVTFRKAYLSPRNYALRPVGLLRGERRNRKAQVRNASLHHRRTGGIDQMTLTVELEQSAFAEDLVPGADGVGIYLGVKLANREQCEIGDFDRLALDRVLRAGERIVITKDIVIPSRRGGQEVAFLKLDLVFENRYWFEQHPRIQSRPFFAPVDATTAGSTGEDLSRGPNGPSRPSA